MLNAIIYITRTGGSWRMMPHDLPPWQAVNAYFRKLTDSGAWERINDEMRSRLRVKLERDAHPITLVIDSQSVKTTEKGGLEDTMGVSE
jgi:putative transposase